MLWILCVFYLLLFVDNNNNNNSILVFLPHQWPNVCLPLQTLCVSSFLLVWQFCVWLFISFLFCFLLFVFCFCFVCLFRVSFSVINIVVENCECVFVWPICILVCIFNVFLSLSLFYGLHGPVVSWWETHTPTNYSLYESFHSFIHSFINPSNSNRNSRDVKQKYYYCCFQICI